MDEHRYHEIVPIAYLAAAIEKGGRPDFVTIGMCARDIAAAESHENPAFRIAVYAEPCNSRELPQ